MGIFDAPLVIIGILYVAVVNEAGFKKFDSLKAWAFSNFIGFIVLGVAMFNLFQIESANANDAKGLLKTGLVSVGVNSMYLVLAGTVSCRFRRASYGIAAGIFALLAVFGLVLGGT